MSRLSRIPSACWQCAAIALLNGVVWALLVPAFWVPDEPVHVGYAQYLAESGHVPRETTAAPEFSQEEDLAYNGIGFQVLGRPSYSRGRERNIDRELSRRLNRSNPLAAGYAVNNPPLYYALEAVPYRLFSGADFWDRLFAMRLLSVLLGALTVALTFLFLREVMPGTPWAWTVGALAVAFQPLFGFISGGVNNDNLAWTCSAALLLALARTLRRGLTWQRGLAVAGALIVGIAAKPAVYGLIPGALLGIGLAWWRAPREQRPEATRGIVVTAGVLAVPALVFIAFTRFVLDRPLATFVSGFQVVPPGTTVFAQLSYLWQSFLPRLPGMNDQFPDYPNYLLWDNYIKGFIGRFGWFQYGFPSWAYTLGLIVLLAIFAAAMVAVVRTGAVRRRWAELVTYATLLLGVFLAAGIAGFRYQLDAGISFEQTRYLFVLLPLWGAVVAAAARAGGKGWGRPVGALLVVLAIGQTALSLLVTANRFYG